MEYSRGGAVIVPACMAGRPQFLRVTRVDQCLDFDNVNDLGASDADTFLSEQHDGPARGDYLCPGAVS